MQLVSETRLREPLRIHASRRREDVRQLHLMHLVDTD
jgi:hypothetical protein